MVAKVEQTVMEKSAAMQALDKPDQAFVVEYLANGFKAGAAYRAVSSKVTQGSSWELGHRKLRKVEVQAAIKEIFAGYCLSREEIFAELAGIATGTSIRPILPYLTGEKDIGELAESDVDVRNIKSVTIKRTVGTERTEPTETVRIEMQDRQAALVNCGKALAMFTERHEHVIRPGPDNMSTPEGQEAALDRFDERVAKRLAGSNGDGNGSNHK